MPRRLAVVAFCAALTIPLLAPSASARPFHYPVPIEEGLPHEGPPEITAVAWLLYDEVTGAVLASNRANERRAMASTTKIMTALLALEMGDLDEMVTISQRAADTGEREIGLVAGEEVQLGALLKAALIHSGNDAATAIAEHIGGSLEGFIELMNDRADQMGLFDTSFANPHGLDAPGHYSSAHDMLDLAREAMSHPEFRDISRSRIVVFPEAPDGTKRIGRATNLLLGEYEGASGIKTGFTLDALLTFVATAEREGRRLYAIVLGSEGERAHFSDATSLFDYGFDKLGIYGTVASGALHVGRLPESPVAPLTTAATIESLVHIAGAGLMASPPVPLESSPEPVEPQVEVVMRQPEEAPATIGDALGHWIELVFGG